MNKLPNENDIIDDQLATFTDRLLEKDAIEEKDSSALDPELRALEQTVLRMKNAFDKDGPNEALIQRMHQNILLRWKQQESKASKSFWEKVLSPLRSRRPDWQSQRSSQQWRLAISLVAVIVMMISIPLLKKVNSTQPAASGLNLNVSAVVVAGVLILVAVWFFRRKS